MSRIPQQFAGRRQHPFSGPVIIVLFLVLAFCQEVLPGNPDSVAADRSGRQQHGLDAAGGLESSFDRALETEAAKLEDISKRLEAVKQQQKDFETRKARIQFMASGHANLLLMPETGIHALERARIRQSVAVGYLEQQIEDTEKEIANLNQDLEQTEEQVGFYERQAAEFQAQSPITSVERSITDRLTSLVSILETKKQRIEDLIEILNSRAVRLGGILPELRSLSAKLDAEIEKRKRSGILERGPGPLAVLWEGGLSEDLAETLELSRQWLFETAWGMPEFVSYDQYLRSLSIFLFFFAVLGALLYLAGTYCRQMMQRCIDAERFWQYVFVKLVEKSIFPAGAAVYMYFYPLSGVFRITPVFVLIPLAVRILVLVAAVRWGLVFLKVFAARTENAVFHRLYLPLTRLFYGVLVYGAGYFFISRVVCYNCITLVAWRLGFELLLLGWVISFSVLLLRKTPAAGEQGSAGLERLRPVFAVLGLLAVLPGIVMELSGYGGMAGYWYSGLAKTAAVVFWAVILMRLLRESDVPAHMDRSEPVEEDELAGRQPYPVRWLLVRLARPAGAAAAVFALSLAWGAAPGFIADIFYAVNYKVTIGDFHLSLAGFVYAVIVLLVIYILTVMVKELLGGWILRDRDLEAGLKDSVVRITGYVMWLIGILIALRVVGISTTSLTVVFGALGIGLGFGLQNIFNNFLSGIILLFERPIQVGDVIEIAGIWGTVREINVRSTQVRTYDNADLIIPNSDFISQRLTNWSFRDARVRRTVEVRVAYGSDTELVRRILIDVAYQHPRILRRPHPEVLFADFGENGLIFRLRFWVHIDWFFIVETDVRFDIDREFRENNITIPFPQRDLHFKSGSRTLRPVTETQDQGTS